MTPFLDESNLMKMIYPMSPLEWKNMSNVSLVSWLFLHRFERFVYIMFKSSN